MLQVFIRNIIRTSRLNLRRQWRHICCKILCSGDRAESYQLYSNRSANEQINTRREIIVKPTSVSKVAMIVAGCLSIGAYVMAQGHGGGMGHGPSGGFGPGGPGGFGPGGPNQYGPTNNPGLSHMSDQGLQSSQFGRDTAQSAIDQHRPSSGASPTATATRTRKARNRRSPTTSASISPKPTPRGHHYGWERGRYNPHRTSSASPTVSPSTSTTSTNTQTGSAPSVSPSISPPYGPTNNPGLSHMSDQGLQSSEFGRTSAQDAINAHRPGASHSPSISASP
jgi:hypothetical protein